MFFFHFADKFIIYIIDTATLVALWTLDEEGPSSILGRVDMRNNYVN